MDGARKERLGQKWVCYSCGARFYDMQKADPLCPKCGVDQRTSPALQAPPTRGRKKAAAPPPPPPPPPPVKEAKRPRYADDDEEAATPAAEDDEEFPELDTELAGDLDEEAIEVPEGEAEVEEADDED
jgi:hypothetical protein